VLNAQRYVYIVCILHIVYLSVYNINAKFNRFHISYFILNAECVIIYNLYFVLCTLYFESYFLFFIFYFLFFIFYFSFLFICFIYNPYLYYLLILLALLTLLTNFINLALFLHRHHTLFLLHIFCHSDIYLYSIIPFESFLITSYFHTTNFMRYYHIL
jgi:hypothetical protein